MTRAAAKLNVVQPAVSNQIKKLETTLKLELFERLPRGLSPTPAGRILYRLFAPVLENFHAAEHQAHALRTAQIQEIAIGMNPYAANAIMSDVLQAFRIRFPEMEVNVEEETSDTLLRRVADGVIDLAIIHFGKHSIGIPATVAALALREEELVFIERDTGNNAKPKTLRLADFTGRPIVVPKSRSGFRHDLERAVAKLHTSLNVKLEINAPGPLLDLVARGDLAAVVPELAARRAIQHLPIRIRRIVQPSIKRSILCVFRKDFPLSPSLSEFVRIVKTEIARDTAPQDHASELSKGMGQLRPGVTPPRGRVRRTPP